MSCHSSSLILPHADGWHASRHHAFPLYLSVLICWCMRVGTLACVRRHGFCLLLLFFFQDSLFLRKLEPLLKKPTLRHTATQRITCVEPRLQHKNKKQPNILQHQGSTQKKKKIEKTCNSVAKGPVAAASVNTPSSAGLSHPTTPHLHTREMLEK